MNLMSNSTLNMISGRATRRELRKKEVNSLRFLVINPKCLKDSLR